MSATETTPVRSAQRVVAPYAVDQAPLFRSEPEATSDEVLTEAISRIARAVAALQPAEVTA